MADSWTSKSEDQDGAAVSLPMPNESGDGNKSADVLDAVPQWAHGKFAAGDWDPSTSKPEPKGEGWESRSETPTADVEDDD